MNNTAQRGEIKIIKIHDKFYISSNESDLKCYKCIGDIKEADENKGCSILIDKRSRFLINVEHISHIENYKGEMRLIMSNGMCYTDSSGILEHELNQYGFEMLPN